VDALAAPSPRQAPREVGERVNALGLNIDHLLASLD
jgi:hypothetical protein